MQFGGMDLYLPVFDTLAAYLESCAKYHPFVDGNKRTALSCAARFLFLNGYELSASNPALEKFGVDVVVKKYEIPKIAGWLRRQSKPLKGNRHKKPPE